MGDILLLTGRPGVGKTTLIRRLAGSLGDRAGGFYTEEIREGGTRVGFRLVALDGRSAIFAHVGLAERSIHRVGRYGVDIGALDRIGVDAVRRAASRRQVVLVDEIGKMELFSDAFRTALDEVASGPAVLVAAITVSPHPWAEAFRRRQDAVVYEITRGNRDRILDAALAWVRRQG